MEPVTAEPALPPAGGFESAAQSGPAEKQKHVQRKRKRSYFMAKLVVGWSVILVAIVFAARTLLHDDKTERRQAFNKEVDAKVVVSEEDTALLTKTIAPASSTISQFLTADTPEARNQFVLDPIGTAAKMARFYSLNPLVVIDPHTLKITGNSVVQLPGRRAIELQWNCEDGRALDAVFVEENGEWHLDWEHYARYSDYPWALFLAGSGDDHGEFRLLARERLAEERKNDATISVVLYAPRFGHPGETGYQSPEFLVPRDTKNGRLLDAGFKLERSGGRVFGVKLPDTNPEGLIRVRAKVRRVEENGERRFELEDVVACHWYSVDEPGVEIPDK
jgi:hypothetical protein